MFRGKPTSHTDTYSTLQHQYLFKRDNLQPLHPTISNHEYSQPAEDEIHLPELMRSYTEESRDATHSGKSHLRTKTLSSLYLTTGPQATSCKENFAFPRRIANRLDLGNNHRPDSVHGLVSIFSRNVWKEKKGRLVGHVSRGSTSNLTARDANLIAKSHDSEFPNSCNTISIPYNFRHIKHTQYNKVPNATQRVQSEQASDLNPSQNRIELERQDLGVDDLHFENFSSETPNAQNCDERRSISAVEKFRARQRTVLRKKRIPCENQFPSQASLYNETRMVQTQTKTPASSLPYLMESIPMRNSSRAPSNVDSVSSSTSELACTKLEWDNSKSSGEDSWPFPNSSCFVVDLPDVEEEEEELLVGADQVIPLIENCASFDYDEKILGSIDDVESISEIGSPAEWDPLHLKKNSSIGESHSNYSDLAIGSWESDIDWCYENEVVADCDYRWIREEIKKPQDEDLTTYRAIKASQLKLQVNDSMNAKNFHSSPLLPESIRSPGLSPVSLTYMSSSTLATPVNLRQDNYTSVTPKLSSPDEPDHMNGFQSEVTTCDFQTQIQHETNHKESFVKDYFTAIPSPISDDSSGSFFGEGSLKSATDRSWSCPQSSPSSRCSSTYTSSSVGIQETTKPSFNRKDGDKIPIIDRRNKKMHFDAKTPNISLPILLQDSRPCESLKTGGLSTQRGRSTTRQSEDHKLPAPLTDQDMNKSRSTSQKSNIRLKRSYGLFPLT